MTRTRESAPSAVDALEPLVGEYIALRYGLADAAPDRVTAFRTAVRRLRLPGRKRS